MGKNDDSFSDAKVQEEHYARLRREDAANKKFGKK